MVQIYRFHFQIDLGIQAQSCKSKAESVRLEKDPRHPSSRLAGLRVNSR